MWLSDRGWSLVGLEFVKLKFLFLFGFWRSPWVIVVERVGIEL